MTSFSADLVEVDGKKFEPKDMERPWRPPNGADLSSMRSSKTRTPGPRAGTIRVGLKATWKKDPGGW
jgi:hypothetical protein